jgi:Ca-activated chloride channel family protein
MTNLELILQPHQQGVIASGAADVHILLRLQAPERPANLERVRTPLHIAVVLDRSGSMSGRPLHEACRCASAIAERLASGDQLAVITYDNRIHVLRPCAPVGDLAALTHEIQSVRAGGSTNLHGGWAAGIETLRKVHRPDVISRVLLLSDGAANDGITDPATLASAAQAAASEGMSTSTYGLGTGFEEGLMTSMAKSGAGRSYYGDSAEDLLDPFMEEFDLLANLVARKLTVSWETPEGWTLTQMNGYALTEPGHWSLPDLAYQSEAWAMFRLQGTLATKPGEALDLGRIKVTWQDTHGKAMESLSLPFSLPTVSGEILPTLPKDSLVANRMAELRIGQLQELAHQAAQAEDWDLVRIYLDEMKTLAADHPWSKAVVDELSSLMERREYHSLTKEFRYGSMGSSSRLTDLNEDLCLPGTSSYTRRKPRQGKAMPLDPDPTQNPEDTTQGDS